MFHEKQKMKREKEGEREGSECLLIEIKTKKKRGEEEGKSGKFVELLIPCYKFTLIEKSDMDISTEKVLKSKGLRKCP